MLIGLILCLRLDIQIVNTDTDTDTVNISNFDTDTDIDTFQTEISILIRYRYDTFRPKYRLFDTDTIVSKVSGAKGCSRELQPMKFVASSEI